MKAGPTPPSPPPLPPHQPSCFRSTVHGTVFGERAKHLSRIQAGDELLIMPGPPTDEEPGIWVHLPGGDLLGHLPPEIERWLAPWMLRGGHATARAIKVERADAPSWRRLLIEVTCAGAATSS
jgi:hypothetical protein